MSTVHSHEELALRPAVEQGHAAALVLLDDPDASSLGAVAWLSVHLAAVDRVVYRAAEQLPDGAARVAQQVHVDHRLVQALWRLDRALTGDVHHRHVPVARLERDVRELLAEHEHGERRLLDALEAVLADDEQRTLAQALVDALPRSPTRPHPHHSRRSGGLGHWAEGVVDRARDLMDSRVVPTPRTEPVLRQLTRWGAYATALHRQDGPEQPRPADAGTTST